MRTLKNIVVFMPLATLILVFFFNGFNSILVEEVYDGIMYNASRIMSEIFGFSLSSILVYSYMAWRHNFCLYSKVAIIGLAFQNMINIIDYAFDLNYNLFIESTSIIGAAIFIIFSFIFIYIHKK
jgi:hypothetical protein